MVVNDDVGAAMVVNPLAKRLLSYATWLRMSAENRYVALRLGNLAATSRSPRQVLPSGRAAAADEDVGHSSAPGCDCGRVRRDDTPSGHPCRLRSRNPGGPGLVDRQGSTRHYNLIHNRSTVNSAEILSFAAFLY